jgi:hypothetical protein
LKRHSDAAIDQGSSPSLDEPDMAELFRHRFRREARQGTYVMRFVASGRRRALELLIKRRFPDLPNMMVAAYGAYERCRHAGELGAPSSLPSR